MFSWIKGWRTFAAAALCMLTGLLELSGAVDFRALLAPFIHDEALLGSIVTGLGILFGVLRFVTSTRTFDSDPEGAVQ
jgi:hypothetical protein